MARWIEAPYFADPPYADNNDNQGDAAMSDSSSSYHSSDTAVVEIRVANNEDEDAEAAETEDVQEPQTHIQPLNKQIYFESSSDTEPVIQPLPASTFGDDNVMEDDQSQWDRPQGEGENLDAEGEQPHIGMKLVISSAPSDREESLGA